MYYLLDVCVVYVSTCVCIFSCAVGGGVGGMGVVRVNEYGFVRVCMREMCVRLWKFAVHFGERHVHAWPDFDCAQHFPPSHARAIEQQAYQLVQACKPMPPQ
jgi:hypothetical protein